MPGVYISWPFCSQKCSFCNFASGVPERGAVERYGSFLLREIREHAWQWAPETIYFGGGTPSLMAPETLTGLLGAIPRERVTETTLECAPGTISGERARDWARLGINRISLGVQSFVTAELRQTGRRHDARIVESDVRMLRDAGIANVNIDLIAGLPGQTRQSWQESLDWVERLAPPHVSVYIFEVDDDSRLGREVMLGGIRYGAALLPSDEVTAELYERAVERLAGMGIERYEISNFARPGWESAHNLKYWRLEPYVGFGLDAHSFDGGRRWSNPDSLDGYLAGAREQPIATDADEEAFFVGLRLRTGIRPSAAQWARFAEPIDTWLQRGFLEHANGQLRLSDAGVLLSNEVLQDFIAPKRC